MKQHQLSTKLKTNKIIYEDDTHDEEEEVGVGR